MVEFFHEDELELAEIIEYMHALKNFDYNELLEEYGYERDIVEMEKKNADYQIRQIEKVLKLLPPFYREGVKVKEEGHAFREYKDEMIYECHSFGSNESEWQEFLDRHYSMCIEGKDYLIEKPYVSKKKIYEQWW